MSMLSQRHCKKPDFYQAQTTKRKIKDDNNELNNIKLPAPTTLICKPLRRITPHENLLVWGKFKGIGWCPGRIADRCELSGPLDTLDESTRWVNWFGDHKYTETHVDDIAAFHDFNQFFQENKYKRNVSYRSAVIEALNEAAKRSGKKFKTDEKTLLWALDNFLPGGYLTFMPNIKRDMVKNDDKQDQQSLNEKIISQETSKTDLVEYTLLRRRNDILTHVRAGRINLQDICLACGDQDIRTHHPCFEGGLCDECKIDYMECMFSSDQNGTSSYCCVCSGGKEIVLCDEDGCNRCFCVDCLKELAEPRNLKQELQKKSWVCYLCRKQDRHGLLLRRSGWKSLLSESLFKCSDVTFATICPCYRPIQQNEPKRRIKVLSLFDGISTGLVAIKELMFSVDAYYASEINQSALYISRAHHPEIYHIGDVRDVNNKELMEWGPFDLLIGGSPCNDLSFVNPARKGLWSGNGSGNLFFEYVRVLNSCMTMAAVHQRPFYWLFENVVHMDQDAKQTITRFLQRNPVLLNAREVSPANRPRFFWGNLPGMQRPLKPGPGDRLSLQECMEPGRVASTTKIGTITTNSETVSNKARLDHFPVLDLSQKQKDVLWVTEIERVFGLPDHYTDKSNLSSTNRRKVLGKSWSIPVIKHLLAPLKDYFVIEE